METLTHCFVCEKEKFTNYLECNSFVGTNEQFTIVACEECGFCFLNPRPDKEGIKSYRSLQNTNSESKNNVLGNKVDLFIKKRRIKKRFKLVSRIKKSGKILEIGCSNGELLSIFKKHNWETVGIEKNPEERKYAQNSLNLDVREEEELVKFEEHFFDVIMLWHVLEKVHDLNKFLTTIFQKIKPDGVLIISLPMCESYDAVLYNKFWAGFNLPMNLYHFTEDSIKALMKKHSFEIKKIIPIKSDSFYMSAKSEKHRLNKNNFLKAFRVGSLSNRMAKLKISPYSSQIFIIKPQN